MSLRKVGDFVNDEMNSIYRETREYRCYSLGYAYGYFSFYKSICAEMGVEKAKQIFADTFSGTGKHCEYFRELIKADEEPDSK